MLRVHGKRRIGVRDLWDHLAKENELIRLAVAQWFQQDTVNERKYDRGGADADRQRQDGGG